MQRRPFISLNEAHEERLNALRAERLKVRAGKSTLFQVRSIAREVRDVELKMSKTLEQEVATLARYRACALDFEEGAMTPIDRRMLSHWREEADSDLNRVKRGLK